MRVSVIPKAHILPTHVLKYVREMHKYLFWASKCALQSLHRNFIDYYKKNYNVLATQANLYEWKLLNYVHHYNSFHQSFCLLLKIVFFAWGVGFAGYFASNESFSLHRSLFGCQNTNIYCEILFKNSGLFAHHVGHLGKAIGRSSKGAHIVSPMLRCVKALCSLVQFAVTCRHRQIVSTFRFHTSWKSYTWCTPSHQP